MSWLRAIIYASMTMVLAGPALGQAGVTHLRKTQGGFEITLGAAKSAVTWNRDGAMTSFINVARKPRMYMRGYAGAPKRTPWASGIWAEELMALVARRM